MTPRLLRPSTSAALLAALAAQAGLQPAAAQNVSWAEFVREDFRLVSAPSIGVGDVEEKDYAWGDLDRDGWIDLVSVRKQPFTTTGRRVNVLFMNESGILTDRTAQYAVATDVPGDTGFMTPTNDRDVAIADVNLDGWLDVITATTFSPNQPKAISHPRVYVNLGEDAGGQWLGLRYEEARIPDWGTYPNMCGVGAGDVTGDGANDLYFSHYEQMAIVDLNDRLLINDGTGFFVDESSNRMTNAMRGSSFGTTSVIADVNGDSYNDILSVSGSGQTGGLTRSSIAYNNPNNEGFFNILQEPYSGAPYHMNTGDLNADGDLDLVISDDSDDVYLLNRGNDAFGRVIWSPAFTYNTDDGFGSNNLVADIDGDGFAESIHCDVDVDLSGCDRRMHLFHNRGGPVGGNVTLFEERSGSHFGALGLPRLEGTHDVAVFDIDNDGDRDLVVGLCTGTRVYMNQRNRLGDTFCFDNAVNSTNQFAAMSATGSVLIATNNVVLECSRMPVGAFGFFLTSQEQGLIIRPGGSQGNLCLGGAIGRYVAPGQIRAADASGRISLPIDLLQIPLPAGLVPALPGDTWNFTAWFRDTVLGIPTSNFANGLSITFR